jgi:hypothetical protein
VTIRRLLKASRLAGLQEVEQRLNRAYRDVLRSLHLVDRNDAIAEIVAKTVIEIGATGVREASEISKIALERLAQLGRPSREAPTDPRDFYQLLNGQGRGASDGARQPGTRRNGGYPRTGACHSLTQRHPKPVATADKQSAGAVQ